MKKMTSLVCVIVICLLNVAFGETMQQETKQMKLESFSVCLPDEYQSATNTSGGIMFINDDRSLVIVEKPADFIDFSAERTDEAIEEAKEKFAKELPTSNHNGIIFDVNPNGLPYIYATFKMEGKHGGMAEVCGENSSLAVVVANNTASAMDAFIPIIDSITPIETKNFDVSTMSLPELLTLQSEINDRISELRKADQPAGDKIELVGTGTTIKSGIDVTYSPARIKLEADKTANVVLTGGKWDYSTNGKQTQRFIDDAATFDVLVESPGDWALTIEPIEYGGTMTISGTGPYVGDFFTFSAPTIVSIEADCSGMDKDIWWSNFIVSLCHQYSNISSWDSEGLTNELLSPGDTFSTEAVIKPTANRHDYFWQIECEPGVEWKITVK